MHERKIYRAVTKEIPKIQSNYKIMIFYALCIIADTRNEKFDLASHHRVWHISVFFHQEGFYALQPTVRCMAEGTLQETSTLFHRSVDFIAVFPITMILHVCFHGEFFFLSSVSYWVAHGRG